MERPKHAHIAFVAVGSNIKPETNIPVALSLLRQHVNVVASSTFYLTRPVGPADQSAFINGVWQIETVLDPQNLTDILHQVERALGRIRTEDKFAPRPIDLDLILYGGFMGDLPGLHLPHPDLIRPFVYIPILELIGNVTDMQEAFQGPIIQYLSQRHIQISSDAPSPGKILGQITHNLKLLLLEK